MNKQELIERIKGLKNVFGNKTKYIEKDMAIRLISELDESQKVVVSEEEAKFLETFDFNCESDVTTALYYVSRTGWGYYLRDNNGIVLKDLSEGLRELEDRKRLIKAILDGYEIEQEKRYRVKVKATKHFLVRDGMDRMFFSLAYKSLFTKKQLEEAGFEWVFGCPGIEIEEVEG